MHSQTSATPEPKTAQCLACGETFSDAKITRHLMTCIRINLATGPASRVYEITNSPPGDWLCHIRVRSEQPTNQHYLHLLVRPSTTIRKLDDFLRATWMEPCCADYHHSMFRKGDSIFMSSASHTSAAHHMDVSVRELWKSNGKGPEYLFDAYTPVDCRVEQFGLYPAKTEQIISLLARNNPPQPKCEQCNQPATKAESFMRPISFHTATATLCTDCAATTNQKWKPLTNSPRTGACKYGTAEAISA